MTTRRRQVALRRLHESLVDLIAVMNAPQLDEILLREAGVTLDRTLFPLLVGIQRFGPIGVVELADKSGRDHTTISRQVAKLADLGLVDRRPSPIDRRVREAVISSAGRDVTDKIDAARLRLNTPVFADWSDRDLFEIERLFHRYVDDLVAATEKAKEADGAT
ncbi:MarR family transcriptional regulator [Actinomadura sp. DC4]|uniref:MarR family winged helix-turn-helix transcriptional regulator n=1 Tax=Actinomadura sp. DC4 TaxID=3055069 RepID=UPI0025B27369|nr:MarR family transcriptional regulator [Actinomadura sp. DC4]MDN3353584.1 MarR family transcriptional regulator [Actinomadura sp. DC4]